MTFSTRHWAAEGNSAKAWIRRASSPVLRRTSELLSSSRPSTVNKLQSSAAARHDAEQQSQHRHPNGDRRNRQKDFNGRVRPFDGIGFGLEFPRRPIAKTKMIVVPRTVRVPPPSQPQ